MFKAHAALAALVFATGPSMAADAELSDTQVDAAFAKADRDKDGRISRAEAKRFGLTERTFRTANPDKDGTLDKKEFAAAIVAQFKYANADDDGTVDWKEARKAGVKSRRGFDAANPDKDKTLDLNEYLSAMTAQAR